MNDADPAEIVREALRTRSALSLVLSQPRIKGSEIEKATFRPVKLGTSFQYQLTRQRGPQALHENHAPDAAATRAISLLLNDFDQAALFTTDADWTLHRRSDGSFKTHRRPPSKAKQPQAESHNRSKQYLLAENTPCPFLEAIGVMTAEGRVRSAMYHKFRQINRFLELVNDIVPELPADRELRIVDFGCGKSSLTFALHHLLTNIHGRTVSMVGLDLKGEVIRDCNVLAKRLGCAGLEFHTGAIADWEATGGVDLSVSLHACDTATDDALAQAVRWGCGVILAVPCCQHEFAPQIANPALAPLLSHGLLRERFAALATDAMRAMLLTLQGYRTQVVEFIDMEHTPKNILLRAVKTSIPATVLAQHQAEFTAYKGVLGLDQPYLERLLLGEATPAKLTQLVTN